MSSNLPTTSGGTSYSVHVTISAPTPSAPSSARATRPFLAPRSGPGSSSDTHGPTGHAKKRQRTVLKGRIGGYLNASGNE
jgi:hypothetical protein